jgi:hypothetical protein
MISHPNRQVPLSGNNISCNFNKIIATFQKITKKQFFLKNIYNNIKQAVMINHNKINLSNFKVIICAEL